MINILDLYVNDEKLTKTKENQFKVNKWLAALHGAKCIQQTAANECMNNVNSYLEKAETVDPAHRDDHLKFMKTKLECKVNHQ